jgi:Ser/Thr protein kinase RdoA (MazF antagonist)
MDELISLPQELLHPQKLFSRDDVLTRPSPVPKQPGVYAWYIRNLPEIVPTAVCHHHNNLALVYVGISNNLRKRIRRHFYGSTNTSTLRRTLGALLIDELNLTPEMKSKTKFYLGQSEEKLSQWLAQNGSVVWLAHQNPRQLEQAVLASNLSLPLNVEGNKGHPFRPMLTRLRQALKEKATGKIGGPPSKKLFFPITRSTPSAEALAPLIEKTYSLTNVRCHLIKGLVLHTYNVSSNDGRFIFRIYPHARRTKGEIDEELALLQHLDHYNIPVSVPIPTHDGRLHFPLNAPEGPRQAALFTYAPGQPFKDRTSPDDVQAFGRLLAHLHRAAESFLPTFHRSPFNYHNLIDAPLTYLEENLPDHQTDWAYLRSIAPTLQTTLESLPVEPPYTTLIHGDLGSNNIHFNRENSAEYPFTLFDFDLCGPGSRAFDSAVFLIEESAETTKAFLAGYQSVSALSSAEIQAIPHLQICQMIWLLALRASYINEWGSAFLPNRFLNNVLQSIKSLLQLP